MQKIKNFYKKLNNYKFKEIHVFKIFLVLFFTVVFCLFYINQISLAFVADGISNVLKSEMQVYYFYVGQGDATLLVFPDKTTMLIDTGTDEHADDLVKQVETVFVNNSVYNIDYLVLTHPHDDHVGGAAKILDKFQVDTILRPKVNASSEGPTFVPVYSLYDSEAYAKAIRAVNREPNCEVMYIEPMEFDISSYTVKFWTPNEINYSDFNDYSPIITVSGDYTFMFTADATQVTENEFIKTLQEIDVEIDIDFLKVAHHGSKGSSMQTFLDTISPSYAIISAGIDNIYNHPNQEVLDRLEVFETFVTSNLGLVAIGVTGDNFCIFHSWVNFDMPLLTVCYVCCVFISLNLKFYKIPKNRKRYLKFIQNLNF